MPGPRQHLRLLMECDILQQTNLLMTLSHANKSYQAHLQCHPPVLSFRYLTVWWCHSMWLLCMFLLIYVSTVCMCVVCDVDTFHIRFLWCKVVFFVHAIMYKIKSCFMLDHMTSTHQHFGISVGLFMFIFGHFADAFIQSDLQGGCKTARSLCVY